MSSEDDYRISRLRALNTAVAKGHKDIVSLRELLICTTDKTTVAGANAYFQQHQNDVELLSALMQIALEGDDAGDAPWAAANVIADFPAAMLLPHKSSLEQLAEHPWMYLHIPARDALAKIKELGVN